MKSLLFKYYFTLLGLLLQITVPSLLLAETTEAAARQIELVISERKVEPENRNVRVTQGENIEMIWNTDELVELHLHGYDISFEVSPGKATSITLKAHATGRFPISSHGFSGEHENSHNALLYLEVYPD